ncbi:hypothetical protein KSP39_PZI003388 [Platanthera zijinensis]|uniref:Plastid lipid-associated protein/fibrillin conserved domain-containing protein n=1 Tax=Platanthera zijinensis TaxID=2320716 RepID=A0AAP0GBV0_9ASPA
MASASLAPIAAFPFHLKANTDLHRLASSLPSSSRSSPRRRHSDGFNLSAGKHSRELTGTEAAKWRIKVSFFSPFLKKKSREDLKEELMEAIAPLDRGSESSFEDQERVDEIARELEAVNPTKEPLKSNYLNGKWELLYTTSRSILQPQRPKILRPFGKIYQAINTDSLRAQNMETWPYFNQVTADLVPLNSRRVAVRFDRFKIGGLIPIKAPERASGELEITYLDEEIR